MVPKMATRSCFSYHSMSLCVGVGFLTHPRCGRTSANNTTGKPKTTRSRFCRLSNCSLVNRRWEPLFFLGSVWKQQNHWEKSTYRKTHIETSICNLWSFYLCGLFLAEVISSWTNKNSLGTSLMWRCVATETFVKKTAPPTESNRIMGIQKKKTIPGSKLWTHNLGVFRWGRPWGRTMILAIYYKSLTWIKARQFGVGSPY